MPAFPPPHVMLHPDDLNSKVFIAIGRCFLSVDNRAMTIKDLAEMTLRFGLSCQNASAAGQAITTYIRAHMQRCEAQQDHPLLLRHPLSGTPSDDDLVEALHSRSGGAHCPGPLDKRVTNFRKGTMVWYLSKAAGAPCPFARAGIRICEYNENGKVDQQPRDAREKKRERDRARRAAQCGQKRKRPLRSCASKRASDSESSSDEEERRPPKIKLTLRLRPSLVSSSPESSAAPSTSAPTPAPAESRSPEPTQSVIDLSKESESESAEDDDDDEEMSVDSSDDDELESDEEPEEEWSMQPLPAATPRYSHPCASYDMDYRRSPSVANSDASPPPDSEEDEDFHTSMTGNRWDYDDDMEWDLEDEEDPDTDARSPGPRSPSVRSVLDHLEGVVVKQEPTDVGGMLDAWEHLDNADRIVKIITQAAAESAGITDYEVPPVKLEALNFWDWDQQGSPSWDPSSPCLEDAIRVKQEEEEYFGRVSPATSAVEHEDDFNCASPLTPLSALSPIAVENYAALRRSTELSWADAELLGPDSVHPRDFEDDEWDRGKYHAKDSEESGDVTVKASVSPLPEDNLSESPEAEAQQSPATTSPHPVVEHAAMAIEAEDDSHSSRSPSLSASVRTDTSPEPLRSPAARIVPLKADIKQQSEPVQPQVVVVRTCEPCNPPVWATEVEGISVYQMTLGISSLLRRIDTDFVNLSPIAKHIGAPLPATKLIPNAMVISRGSPIILGTWVPLASAQSFIREHPLPGAPLDIFLSDVLYERFPKALHDFHKSNPNRRLLNHFGPHFRSTLELRLQTSSSKDPFDSNPWDMEESHEWKIEDHLMAVHTPYMLLTASGPLLQEDAGLAETPLSPTEQEMFHTLCAAPDWDDGASAKDVPEVDQDEERAESEPAEEEKPARRQQRPLRRSKRVANAIAARSRTRSSKRASRGSLS